MVLLDIFDFKIIDWRLILELLTFDILIVIFMLTYHFWDYISFLRWQIDPYDKSVTENFQSW